MYEGAPHIWSNERVGSAGGDDPTAHLADLINPADPALGHIAQELARFTEAGVELTEELVTAAIKLGRAAHTRWRSADGSGFKAAAVPLQSSHDPVTYYVRRGATVKIGTTTNIRERMVALLPEEVLAIEPGGQPVEFQRHRQFSALRVDGQREWFHAGPALQEHVQRVREQYGVPDPALPGLPTS
ncbi:GIY-YIG nuclease family protein [Streptomyces lunaelactis]|uniref:GIY-YIG nuclease family protein n=1 Tax=Streptomyces lunaelactis TaxID=1535768 RepID=UPI0015857294|nr:GIY-YIG nuclease family protein [Streptomyces lunaelactis]NUL03585.1 GIY-YIG nuclease family protein [Streptomyces lunaelactis]